MKDLKQWEFKIRNTSIFIVASSEGICSIFFHSKNIPMLIDLKERDGQTEHIKRAVLQLEEYFSRKRKTFDLTYDISGTDFQKKVWSELQKIPYGETCSYSDIAAKIQNPKGVRAVGTANGKNPLSIVVPCHRVIAADGTLGGYSGGIERKIMLLELERKK